MIAPLLLALMADHSQGIRQGVSWDAEPQIAYAFRGIPRVRDRFFLRGRFGLLWASEPWFITVGATVEAFALPKIAGGFQASVSHLQYGFWAHGGASINGDPDVLIHLGAGFTLLGFEWQRNVPTKEDAFLILLRIPVGIFFFAR